MAYTTDYKITGGGEIGHQPITAVSTTQKHPLGTVVQAVDRGSNQNGMGKFMYVKGVASGARGACVLIEQDSYLTTLTVADGYGKVGWLMSDLDAATKYGWAQIGGKAVGKVLAAFADNGQLYLTSTPGSLDDAAVAGDHVNGARGASAIDGPETGMAEIEADDPWVDNDVDDST